MQELLTFRDVSRGPNNKDYSILGSVQRLRFGSYEPRSRLLNFPGII